MSKGRRALRWATAGFFSYLSWLIVNIILAVIFPLLVFLRGVGATGAVRVFLAAVLRVYFLKVLPVFGLYRVNRDGQADRLRQIRQGLIVVNHTSWLDALVIIALVPKVRPLVSTRYGKVPLVSATMRWLGCIFIDRKDRASVAQAVETIRAALNAGEPVAVFPEGTRSMPGQLKPFQEVFFSLAVEQGAVIEPVLLLLDRPFLGPGTENFLTERAADLKILKLPSIIAEHKERGRDLAFRTRRIMRNAMKIAAV